MIKQLTFTESMIMLAGAILMIVGITLLFFGLDNIAPWVFLLGAGCFSTMQLKQSYEGTNFTIRRLRRIMIAGDIAFLLAALLMIENVHHFLLPTFLNMSPQNGYLNYVRYINNNWVVMLLVASVLELYSTHRISHELREDAKKN